MENGRNKTLPAPCYFRQMVQREAVH